MNDRGTRDDPNIVTAKLTISRQDLATHLTAYGEQEAAA
jgi:hypothetical protein